MRAADRQFQERRAATIQRTLADSIICDRCGATLITYGDDCSAPLDEACPGFLAIEAAAMMENF